MPADIFSSFLGMTLQSTGNNNNAWGTILNGSALQTIEKAIAGNTSHAVTGGTLDLSGSPPPAGQTQVLEMLQILTGVLTSAQTIKVPNVSKSWIFFNGTTGAFPVLVQTPTGAPIGLPGGVFLQIFCDGSNNIWRLDRDSIGTFVYGAMVPNNALQCSGQSLLKASYPDLYAVIGTTFGSVDGTHFTLPLLTDTGRFLRSTSGSLTVGTYQANQNLAHTHAGASFSGTSGGQSNDHSHVAAGTTGVDAPDHFHNINGGASFTVGSTSVGSGPSSPGAAGPAAVVSGNSSGANTRHTHVFSVFTAGVNLDHTHNFSGTTGTIPSSGGAEARPESLAVIISIRY